MATKFLFLLGLLPLTVLAQEDCSPEALDLTEETHIVEKLFYTGTCHYRNQEYKYSAKSWKELADLANVEPDFKELQISSLNNLGYLLFFGYGLEKDQVTAIKYWTKAVSLGHAESEYHLCHAFADRDEGTYNLQRAKAHCSKAEFIYLSIDEKDDSDKEILKQIQTYKEAIGLL